MRPWLLLLLLLVSLLVSDLSPLGDGDWVMENFCWCFCRKLPLNGQMTPRGLQILQTQTGHRCMCIQRNRVYVAEQHKQRTSPFYWVHAVHDEHGGCLTHQEFKRLIHRNHVSALVVSLPHGVGNSVSAFLVKSDTLPALHIISQTTPTQAGDISHVAMDIIKDHAESGSAWLRRHHKAAPGHSFQAFLLEKSKNWAPATIVQLQKLLRKRYCASTTESIFCCFAKGAIRSAMNIKKTSRELTARPQRRQKEKSTQSSADINEHDGQQPVVSQRDIFRAAAQLSSSSSMKTSHISQLDIKTNGVKTTKTNEQLNLDEVSLLQKTAQRQKSLKAASTLQNDDGFHVKKQLLLETREKIRSMNSLRFKIKASQDDNKEDFRGKTITKEAGFRRPEGESQTGPSHKNTIESGNQKRLAHILRAGSTYKTVYRDGDHKQMLTAAREDASLLFFGNTEKETETKPSSSERKLIPNTDTVQKTVRLPMTELNNLISMTKVIKENFVFEPDKFKCKSLENSKFSVMYALKGEDIKLAESTTDATTVSAEEQVKDTTEKTENTVTNNTSHENVNINHSKQEGNVPSDESLTLSPPELEIIETETMKTERRAETTTVNMEIKQTTSSAEVFNQGSTQKEDVLPRTEETTTSSGPRCMRCKTGKTQTMMEKPFSGLRMREKIPANKTRLHESTRNKEGALTNRPESEREEGQNDTKGNSFTFEKPSQTIHKQATDEPPKAAADSVPLCRGLIHRTEAGWKLCLERFAGTGSNIFSSREPGDAFKDTAEPEKKRASFTDQKDNLQNDEEYDHFYYFDGVLRRVQSNFYPYYTRQRQQKSSQNTESRLFTERKGADTRENLPTYIRRLTLRNKASHFK